MSGEVLIREFRAGDEPALWRIFHDTIHEVCCRDYSPAQIAAWAPDECDQGRWRERMRDIQPLIAEINGEIAGYADIQASGYIDHFYCHHRFQRRGVGSALMRAVESRAASQGIDELGSDVSITARPFFERKGFIVIREQRVPAGEEYLTNFHMRRKIA